MFEESVFYFSAVFVSTDVSVRGVWPLFLRVLRVHFLFHGGICFCGGSAYAFWSLYLEGVRRPNGPFCFCGVSAEFLRSHFLRQVFFSDFWPFVFLDQNSDFCFCGRGEVDSG